MSRQEMNVWWTARTIEVIWDMLLPFASGLLMLYGGMQVLKGQLSPGDLMMFLIYLTMLLEPIAVIATSATQFQSNLAAFDRVLDILSEPRELSEQKSTRTAEAVLFEGPIRIENVSFRYPKNNEFVLKEINLEIEPGSLVALVGKSGSGKTTLCNLLRVFTTRPWDGSLSTVSISGRSMSRPIESSSGSSSKKSFSSMERSRRTSATPFAKPTTMISSERPGSPTRTNSSSRSRMVTTRASANEASGSAADKGSDWRSPEQSWPIRSSSFSMRRPATWIRNPSNLFSKVWRS